jgi:hypothetical protein
MAVTTFVVEGKLPGRFSFTCSKCGYCGGNYATREEAQRYADLHRDMKAPEHQ